MNKREIQILRKPQGIDITFCHIVFSEIEFIFAFAVTRLFLLISKKLKLFLKYLFSSGIQIPFCMRVWWIFLGKLCVSDYFFNAKYHFFNLTKLMHCMGSMDDGQQELTEIHLAYFLCLRIRLILGQPLILRTYYTSLWAHVKCMLTL